MTLQVKSIFCTIVAVICSAIAAVYNHYETVFISNKVFIILLFGVWLVDIVFGMGKHWIKHDFNFKLLFVKAMLKVLLSFGAMVLTNAFTALPQIASTPPANWFTFVCQMINLVWIAGSAWTSCYYISGQKFPPRAFMERMEKFNKTLNPKDLTQDEKQE